MKASISKLNSHQIETLKNIQNKSEEGKYILSKSEFKYNLFIIFVLSIPIVVSIIFYLRLSWDSLFLLYGSSIVFSYFMAHLIYVIYYCDKYPISFLYFSSEIILKKDGNTIQFQRTKDLQDISFINSEYNSADYPSQHIKLKFRDDIIEYYYPKKYDTMMNFITLLKAELSNRDRRKNNDAIKTQYNLFADNSKLVPAWRSRFKTVLPFTLITSILLILLIPTVSDWNAYKKAKKNNTATSYRDYIGDERNSLFMSDAKLSLKRVYDKAILKYKYQYPNSKAAESLIQILEFLKVNELYKININIKHQSNIRDLSYDDDLKIISAEDSFTENIIISRNKRLISNLNNTLGKIFPNDLIIIEEISDSSSFPLIEIQYTYENSTDGALYYPIEQEFITDKERTYYYGLSINWNFKLFLPNEKNSLYAFYLYSEPALQFSSENYNTDNVYSNMVFSAFKDFESEFDAHFK